MGLSGPTAPMCRRYRGVCGDVGRRQVERCGPGSAALRRRRHRTKPRASAAPPWVIEHHRARATPTGLPRCGAGRRPADRLSANCTHSFGNACGVHDFVSRSVTQGALRDPGLRSATPSAWGPDRHHSRTNAYRYAEGVTEQSPGPAQRRPGWANANEIESTPTGLPKWHATQGERNVGIDSPRSIR
jgi:hypothetical protein